ncbi:MAG: DUF2256 domain-containing protein [Verrucomicrobiota bacterium]|nr:DUF2256 domain-containing protein [Verrucomicrobiota bacterium]MEC7401825.1 DUF2256 domain-containing protein [Verrucomicrobiota bacterium]MEC8655681.1 DUF2256 domain-containing protein [Verrucomicrobiota bacterium]MEC8789858.1 DUF2256 domain-containing protein [Verrucomicrobiota bacterium]MEC8866478.1 DUF2256 domain-containing protein [Verrucomicrobiota bacterium]
MKAKPVETKICRRCGRSFDNRRKWRSRGIWEEVAYCSKKCGGSARGKRKK